MKLDKYFKQAIQEGDWGKICKVYTTITGEVIEPPKVKQEVDWGSLEIEDEAPKAKASKKKPVKAKTVSGILANGKPNKFIDDGSLHADEMVTVRPDLGIQNPRPRTPSKKVKINCRRCGNSFEVAPTLVVVSDDGTKSYVCDECVVKGVKE